MSDRIQIAGLQIDPELYNLVETEIAPGTGVDTQAFWEQLAAIVNDLAPTNAALLETRNEMQAKIDAWCAENPELTFPNDSYKAFLESIGYLLPEGEDFKVQTQRVDPEIASMAGPQLVVPVDNARYALNATNARWGSLFDALYGTNVIPETERREKGLHYNKRRGAAVIEKSNHILDTYFPLEAGSWHHVTMVSWQPMDGRTSLVFNLQDGSGTALADPKQFVGYNEFYESGETVREVCLVHNHLHVIIQIDRNHPVGASNPAGIKDVIMEAAITTIQDFEDSVSAVDAEDKARVYRNWAGLMKGTLTTDFTKEGRQRIFHRELNDDKTFTAPEGQMMSLPGRSLLLARNVGIHMYTDAVLTAEGNEIPEGILDVMVSSLAAMHDLKRLGKYTNSRAGSFYIVKPKQHGPEEVAFTCSLFGRVEDALGLERNTLKMGIMDEERRTTINLKECIREAKERIVFINTGFLDRTGDEIHTSMKVAAMQPKMEIKNTPWILAYEDWNVDIGIETGLPGKAQIGKGMWTMPDNLKTMMETKQAHPEAGATTAWVPSPTAATLHALHYHAVDVFKRLQDLAKRKRADLNALLTPPLLKQPLTPTVIQKDLDNNAQGILGYVVRWIDQGVGCSKVPDIHNNGLMEDRATLRISSQHIANWLLHGLVKKDQVIETFKRMAAIVDQQNEGDPAYRPMAPNFEASVAFQGALDLVFMGVKEPNGYTEPTLHRRRRELKAKA